MMLPGYHHTAAYDHHGGYHHAHHHHHHHAALYPHHALPHGHGGPDPAAMRPSRLFFKMPRVVPKQKERFEEEDIFKRNTREQEVSGKKL